MLSCLVFHKSFENSCHSSWHLAAKHPCPQHTGCWPQWLGCRPTTGLVDRAPILHSQIRCNPSLSPTTSSCNIFLKWKKSNFFLALNPAQTSMLWQSHGLCLQHHWSNPGDLVQSTQGWCPLWQECPELQAGMSKDTGGHGRVAYQAHKATD